MATIKDIAQITGFSCTTVSNVIHGKAGRVSAETIEKIENAITQLAYVPNMTARSLVSNSSKVIGMINHVVTKDHSNFMEDPFHSSFTGAIEQTLRENGYYLMLRTVETSEELITFLQNWNVDGLFFTGIFKDRFFDVLSTLKIPIVFIDSYVHHPNFCNVGLEDFTGSYTATKHLIDNGHKRIAFASPSTRDGGVLQERFLGYKAALTENNIPFDKSLVCENEMDIDSCIALSGELMNMPGVTGLVVTADVMAAGIISGLRHHGLQIPEDISIVGFDDISLCCMVTPNLTTIHQDIHLKGKLAVDFMLQRLEGKIPEKAEIILPTYLVERESVRNLNT
ncbi:MAG: LacI family DNA-binding transcriptional regulator [Vallitaleaceae bacterium]|nr:LacI family DNA-binding transcriptional regulator [Vallitaleaceae bacterium]